MENLEDDAQDTVAAATTTHSNASATNVDVSSSAMMHQLTSSPGEEEQDFDDSVILLQPRIDVVDLTASPGTSTAASAGTGATELLKPKIEDPSGM